jgi:hypothetical protein
MNIFIQSSSVLRQAQLEPAAHRQAQSWAAAPRPDVLGSAAHWQTQSYTNYRAPLVYNVNEYSIFYRQAQLEPVAHWQARSSAAAPRQEVLGSAAHRQAVAESAAHRQARRRRVPGRGVEFILNF